LVEAQPPAFIKSPATSILAPGGASAWDEKGVGSACVISDSGTYKVWYTGYDNNDILQIGYATSTDGRTWSKQGGDGGPVVAPGAGGTEDAEGVGSPAVVKDGASDYKMWYTGYKKVGEESVPQIFYATSTDGITWAKQNGGNPVLTVGGGGAWDERGTWGAAVINDGGTYKMWYTGRSGTSFVGDSAIGYATSADGSSWTKQNGGNAVLDPAGGTWYQSGVATPSVIKPTTEFVMWFAGFTGFTQGSIQVKIGVATSTDGITDWTVSPNPLVDKETSGWSAGGVGAPWVVENGANEPLEMWYSGVDSGLVPRLGYAATGAATLTCTAKLQGDNRLEAGYDVPLTLKLYTVAITFINITTATPSATFSTTGGEIAITNTDTGTKTITFTVTGVPPGLFNATLFTPYALVNYRVDNAIPVAGTTIDMGELKAGDAIDLDSGSTTVDITDFATFAGAYNAIPTSGNWNVAADFDRDDYVGIVDFSMLYTNYGQLSPNTVP